MTLDLTSLSKAIAQTDDALGYCASDLARQNVGLRLHLRAAAIQAFEFTYELSIKTLKRYLEATLSSSDLVDQMSFNELVRAGYEAGLLDVELTDWKAFRKSRGITSHTYDENKAQSVFESIPAFLKEAKFLEAQIRLRQDIGK